MSGHCLRCEGSTEQGYSECRACLAVSRERMTRLCTNGRGEWTGGRKHARELADALFSRLEVLPDASFCVESVQPTIGARAIWRGVPKVIGERIDMGRTDTPAILAARDFHNSRGLFLCLSGSTGTGKSFAAACLVGGAPVDPDKMAARVLPKWQTASAIAAALESWDKGVEERVAIKCARDAPLLVVDDMGEEVATERATSRMRAMICEREVRGQRTIITTNLDQQRFAAKYGERLVSRILGAGVWHTCEGADMRRATT